MNTTLVKALVALVPTGALVAMSVTTFAKRKSLASVVQLAGAGCLVVVVLTHVAEALQVFPWMHWGEEHSIGHYLDLSSAVLGVILLPLGFWMRKKLTP
jgi:hypothetical protein